MSKDIFLGRTPRWRWYCDIADLQAMHRLVVVMSDNAGENRSQKNAGVRPKKISRNILNYPLKPLNIHTDEHLKRICQDIFLGYKGQLCWISRDIQSFIHQRLSADDLNASNDLMFT